MKRPKENKRQDWPIKEPGRRRHAVALCVADLHLSHEPPVFRAEKGEEWYVVMKRQLDQLRQLQWKHSCPVLYAGDLFNKADNPAELVNFAIDHLPRGISVPGNHDLPFHRYADRRKSSYHTLVKAAVLIDVHHRTPWCRDTLRVHGFPAGVEPQPNPCRPSLALDVALVHKYLWVKGRSFPNAPQEDRLRNQGWIESYDAVIVGDNHVTFLCRQRKTWVLNCGGFYRRNADQKDHRPCVGLLLDDGSIRVKDLNCSEDRFADEPINDNKSNFDASRFVAELREEANETGLDFKETVARWIKENKPGKGTRRALLEAMEGGTP